MAHENLNVDRMLEEIGFRKFHLIAFFIIALRPFSYASTSGFLAIIEPYLRCQWRLKYMDAAWLVLPDAATNIAGSIILGKLSDRYGRRRVMLLAFTFNSYLTLLYALSSSVFYLALIRGMIGLVSSSIMVSFTYIMEFLPISKRKYMSLFELAFCAGAGYSILVSMVSLENLTWRWFGILAETIPIALGAFAVFFLPESPRFLASAGREDEALKILQKISRSSRITCSAGYESVSSNDSADTTEEGNDSMKEGDEKELSGFGVMKRIALASFLQFYSNSLAGTMRFGSMQFGENSEISQCEKCSEGLVYKYRGAMVIAVLFSAFPTFWLLKKCPRRVAFIILFLYAGGCLVPFYWKIRGWHLVIATILFSLSFCSLNIVVYVYRAELIPTRVRAFGCGISEACGQIGLLFGQFIAVYVFHSSIPLSFGMLHGLTAVALVMAVTVVVETKNKHLN